MDSSRAMLFLRTRYIGAQKSAIVCFIEASGRQFQNRLCRVLLAGGEEVTVEFEKQDSHHKARALIAIHEGMVAHDAGRYRLWPC